MTPIKCVVIFAPCLLVNLVYGQLYGDEIGDVLIRAKSKHATSIATAKATLIKSIDAQIKKTAAGGKLDDLKLLIATKEVFESDGTIPTDSELSASANAYTQSRKVAAMELQNSYEKAIKDYTTKLLVTEATAIDTEMKAFLEAESIVEGGSKRRRRERVGAVEIGGAHWCISEK